MQKLKLHSVGHLMGWIMSDLHMSFRQIGHDDSSSSTAAPPVVASAAAIVIIALLDSLNAFDSLFTALDQLDQLIVTQLPTTKIRER